MADYFSERLNARATMGDTVEGQIVHIRKLSKKLVFFDLEPSREALRESPEEASKMEERVTVILKLCLCGEEVMVQATKTSRKLHVGDLVRFSGLLEDRRMFNARTFVVEKYWSVLSPGTVFSPRPPEDQWQEEEQEQGLCKFYLNTGRCPKVSCKFGHTADLARRAEAVRDKEERRLLQHEGGSGQGQEVAGGSQRAKVFADWVVSVWGLARLERGLVLDIAGGRGDLAFELARRGLDCATVDPRPPKLKRWQAKFRKKHPEVKVPEHYQDYFSEDFLSSRAIPSSSVSLVVGLHPDEATEPGGSILFLY